MKIRWIFIGILLIIILILITTSFYFKKKHNEIDIMQPRLGTDISQSKESLEELWAKAGVLLDKGEYLQAKDKYQKIITDFPNAKNISDVKKKLEELNIKIVFSRLEVPSRTQIYEVKKADTLEKIAKQFNTTVGLIKKSNNLQSDLISVGQKLRIWTQKFSCVVDKSQNILILKSDEEVIKTYIVSTGANNSTPIGTFKIVNKLVNPVWYKAGAIVLPESSDNILGSRWLGFDIAGYGIHGTTEPKTIGQQITQGCVRMLDKDVEEIYDLLPAGTEVTIVD